jgi:hypothetical protein
MSITPATMRTGLLLVILCLSGGCVHHNTRAQRDASFAPYKDAKVGAERLGDYLLVRSAVLFMADRVDILSSGTNFSFSYAWTNLHDSGMATAIDPRGYFLTAAHCVEDKRPCWLLFQGYDKVRVERARIVWRGHRKKGEPDLAILCVSQPIGATFPWATEFTNGSLAVEVGVRRDNFPRELEPQCMAGKVLEVSKASSAGPLDYSVVFHSSPMRPGDSGGPVVLSDGRLLGINVIINFDFQWSHLALNFEHTQAHRPDLAWLRKVIDADAALFPREISSP